MAVVHIDIITFSDYTVKNTVKINGNVVNEVYFTRNIIKLAPSPSLDVILAVLPFGVTYAVTNNQDSPAEDVYIIDTVDAIAPTSLLDLNAKLAALMKF